MDNLQFLHSKIAHYIKLNWKKSFNEPTGQLHFKFLDPAAAYRTQLWDWDSYFCSVALADVYDDTALYTEGCVRNFLSYARADGSIPYMINAGCNKMEALPELNLKERGKECDLNSIKPLLAQMLLLSFKKTNNSEFVRESYGKLQKHINHWEKTQQAANKLFVWRSCRGSGTDNHPALYGRPLNSSAGVELNSFMYLEYMAMAEIASICGFENDSARYENKAKMLADAVNEHMWDNIDGLYYHLDMSSSKPPTAHQEISWDVPMKFRTWTCFAPMYANFAPRDYADRMVREHIINSGEFWSDYGIRTLAKNEKAYNTEEMSNPSNWQGPIWIVSNYIIFKGLINYGYNDIAKKLCENLLSNLYNDIMKNGAMHEYYNPENGSSNINLGFMNWNALAGIMVPELKNSLKKAGSSENEIENL